MRIKESFDLRGRKYIHVYVLSLRQLPYCTCQDNVENDQVHDEGEGNDNNGEDQIEHEPSSHT